MCAINAREPKLIPTHFAKMQPKFFILFFPQLQELLSFLYHETNDFLFQVTGDSDSSGVNWMELVLLVSKYREKSGGQQTFGGTLCDVVRSMPHKRTNKQKMTPLVSAAEEKQKRKHKWTHKFEANSSFESRVWLS